MKDVLDRMYKVTGEYLANPVHEKLAKAQSYEKITDNIQKEVTVFLCKVMEKPMSEYQSKQSQALVKIVDEFESIADYLDRIVSYKSRFKENSISGSSLEEYETFMKEVWDFFQLSCGGLTKGTKHNLDAVYNKSEELRIWADDMRDKHIDRVSKGEYNPLSALTFSDMVVALRKVRAHSMNVAQAIDSYQGHE